MKKSTKSFFFGVVLLGSYYLGMAESIPADEFKSLHERSPFGDAPKPEPKPLLQASTPKTSAAPPVPKKPEKKLGFTGYLKMDGKNYFSIHDKTPKDEIHTVVSPEKLSPLGYTPVKFDEKQQTLEINFEGYTYPCKIGEEEKKTTTTTTTNTNNAYPQSTYQNSKQQPPLQAYPGPTYGWDWDDDWDDWDEW
ncbi:MAG: hypothetical protein LBR92_03460 [Puniceicoccales bacterium]|nr:hypothetical protein [Puniceicoccales bacterium]